MRRKLLLPMSIAHTGATAESGVRQPTVATSSAIAHRRTRAVEAVIHPESIRGRRCLVLAYDRPQMKSADCILFSGGASGAEGEFGACAERHGIEEVNFTFDGHKIGRQRGTRVLNHEE